MEAHIARYRNISYVFRLQKELDKLGLRLLRLKTAKDKDEQITERVRDMLNRIRDIKKTIKTLENKVSVM